MIEVITNRLVASLKPQPGIYEVRDKQLKGFLLRVRPSGVMTYFVQYGRAKRIKIGPADALAPHQARDMAKQVLADVLKGADPMEAKRKAKEHTLDSFIESDYRGWAEANIKTAGKTLSRLKGLSELRDLKLGEITPWHVEKWRQKRLKQVKPSSVNRELADLKSALSKAKQWGLLEKHPLVEVKACKVDTKGAVRFLSPEEEGWLRHALTERERTIREERSTANQWREARGYPMMPIFSPFEFADHLQPIVLLAMNTGLRRGELFSLTWADVDLAQANLTVHGDVAKSGQTRHVPLNDEALNVLQKWRLKAKAGNGLVFPGEGGDRLDIDISSISEL